MSITEHELEERAISPRVTLRNVEDSILFEYYFTAADGIRQSEHHNNKLVGKVEKLEGHTFCVLVLKNGFTVSGQSSCVDPKNYQKDIGDRVAREDAIKNIWPLLGYELRTKLSEQVHA